MKTRFKVELKMFDTSIKNMFNTVIRVALGKIR